MANQDAVAEEEVVDMTPIYAERLLKIIQLSGQSCKCDGFDKDIVRACLRLIFAYLGEDPNREGLLETPDRIIKSYKKLYGGYLQDPEKTLGKTFEVGYEQMVVLANIPFYSTCEHHMLPFFGKAHIGYIPKKIEGKYRVVGISKLARLLECYARRLQIQERLTIQIAETIEKVLDPVGIAVVIEAQHFCMTARGVEKSTAVMKTNCMKGVFLEKAAARQEFFMSCK
jgi:GTP cyclohydrolase IA